MPVDPDGPDLEGLIDLHVHTAPDVVERYADDIDIAHAAAAEGMRAVLLKSHVTVTADRAAIAQKVVPGLRVFGGLALNEAVGGLNPCAVEAALRLGAREIWLPTLDAANDRSHRGRPGGLSVFSVDGSIVPSVHEILDLIRDGEAILGTGHLSAGETMAVIRLARERGVRAILITHPEAPFINLPLAAQEEVKGPDVFFERCYVFALPPDEAVASVARMAAHIRRVGIESTVLSTDLGQASNPSPVAGLRQYLARLRNEGFSWPQIRRMAGENAAYLLGL